MQFEIAKYPSSFDATMASVPSAIRAARRTPGVLHTIIDGDRIVCTVPGADALLGVGAARLESKAEFSVMHSDGTVEFATRTQRGSWYLAPYTRFTGAQPELLLLPGAEPVHVGGFAYSTTAEGWSRPYIAHDRIQIWLKNSGSPDMFACWICTRITTV
jgi:hypothetical protein